MTTMKQQQEQQLLDTLLLWPSVVARAHFAKTNPSDSQMYMQVKGSVFTQAARLQKLDSLCRTLKPGLKPMVSSDS